MKFKDTPYGNLTGKHHVGDIFISRLGVTSLEGAPDSVSGVFYCSNNNLTSLEGAPKEVRGSFFCDHNNLSSLKGSPIIVGGDFFCEHNKIISLDGIPREIGAEFYASDNKNPHLEEEWEVRKHNPSITEKEFMKKMYLLTKDQYYLPNALKKVFLIKDKK